MESAIRRRLKYEIGIEVAGIKEIISKYIYKTPAFKNVIEHEFCPIFATKVKSEPKLNSDEVEDYKWLDWKDYKKELKADDADTYSWWAKNQITLLTDSKLKDFIKT